MVGCTDRFSVRARESVTPFQPHRLMQVVPDHPLADPRSMLFKGWYHEYWRNTRTSTTSVQKQTHPYYQERRAKGRLCLSRDAAPGTWDRALPPPLLQPWPPGGTREGTASHPDAPVHGPSAAPGYRRDQAGPGLAPAPPPTAALRCAAPRPPLPHPSTMPHAGAEGGAAAVRRRALRRPRLGPGPGRGGGDG